MDSTPFIVVLEPTDDEDLVAFGDRRLSFTAFVASVERSLGQGGRAWWPDPDAGELRFCLWITAPSPEEAERLATEVLERALDDSDVNPG